MGSIQGSYFAGGPREQILETARADTKQRVMRETQM